MDWKPFRAAYVRINNERYRREGRETEKALGQLDGLEMALTELEDAFRHTHVKSDEDDICALCGLDLRNDIHVRLANAKDPAHD